MAPGLLQPSAQRINSKVIGPSPLTTKRHHCTLAHNQHHNFSFPCILLVSIHVGLQWGIWGVFLEVYEGTRCSGEAGERGGNDPSVLENLLFHECVTNDKFTAIKLS